MKTKLDRPAPAAELYTSALFTGTRRAVEASCDRWFVLSARHGLLDPTTVIEPYDETLATASRRHRRQWSQQVLRDLTAQVGPLADHNFEIHAGAAYYDHGLKDGLERAGAQVVVPVEGLALGQRLAYYATGRRPEADVPAQAAASTSGPGPAGRRSTAARQAGEVPPPTGKYRALYDHLAAFGGDRWDATLADIEQVLGCALPASAHRHAAWWGNARDGSHPHARAWLAAGFETASVRVGSGRVMFQRVVR